MDSHCQQLECRTFKVVLKNVSVPSIHMKIINFLNDLLEASSTRKESLTAFKIYMLDDYVKCQQLIFLKA
jgi:hypothetical protein